MSDADTTTKTLNRRTDRKEVQRRHRERVKQAKEQTEQQVKQLTLEAQHLQIENSLLEQQHLALTQLDHYSQELLAACKACQTTAETNPVAETKVIQEMEKYLMGSLDKGEFPPETWFREVFMKLPPTVLLGIERSYFMSIDKHVSIWKSSPSSREAAEQKLAMLSTARRRIGLMMLELRPEIHEKIMSNTMPSSITPSQQTMAMVDSLAITPEQAQAMLPAWIKFNAQIESLQSQAEEARRLLLEAASQVGENTHTSSSMSNMSAEMAFLDNCQSKQATRLLKTTEATLFLADFQKKLMNAYGILAIQVSGELTAVQHSKLLLHCDPCLPDYMQICTYLIEPLREKNGAQQSGLSSK